MENNREEEIKKELGQFKNFHLKYAFSKGVKWADAHPVNKRNLVHDINFAKTKDLNTLELNELFMACSNLQQVIIKELIYREENGNKM